MEENDAYAILDYLNARWRVHPQRPKLGYGGHPAFPLQAIHGSPRFVEAIRANVSGNDIYTAPQGLFVSVSLRPRLQSFGPRIAGQLVVEFAVAFGLSLLLLATPLRSSIRAAGFLGLAGLIAGVDGPGLRT